MMARDFAVKVDDFRKVHGDFAAVDGISFAVERGEVFGLLGPNGAGKTSTRECLEGLRSPTSGSLDIEGINPARDGRRLRNPIGVQLQVSATGGTTCEEAMRFFCAYHGWRHAPIRWTVVPAEKRRSTYESLSVGQQRRLALARLLLTSRRCFLDELTAGLDVESRTEPMP